MPTTTDHRCMRSCAVLVLATLALAACSGDETPAVDSAPAPVADQGAPPAQPAAPDTAEESRLKKEAKAWTEQTKELGSAAVDSSRETLGDLSEKGGETWKDVKTGSAELYESAKAKTGELYEAAKEKGKQAADYAAEEYSSRTQEDGKGVIANEAAPE